MPDTPSPVSGTSTAPLPFSPFAQVVSQLADKPDAEIHACTDRDMRDCARQLKAARRVAYVNYQALEAHRAAR